MNGAIPLPLDRLDLEFESSEGSLIRRSILPSGLRILTEQVPGARSATIGLWVPVGSRDETNGHFGSTHFLEHLLFKGTQKRSALDIAISFDSVGGEHNALTAKEHTCYYAKIRDRDLPMAVEVLCDMIASSVLDADEFEIERGVILEELAMSDDDPASVVNDKIFEAVLGDLPLARPIGGNQESIRGVSRDAVWEHYRQHYVPSNLVITVAGAVVHEELVKQVSDAFSKSGWGTFGDSNPAQRRQSLRVEHFESSPLAVVNRPLEQANLILGFPGITSTDDRKTTMAVMNSVLGGGMSSRLFQEIRERRGLAYSVYSFSAAYSDAGIFGLYAGCSPTKANEVAELMLDELSKLAAQPITSSELERAIGQLSGTSALALEDSDSRMARLGSAELSTGEFVDLDEALRRLDAVTPEAVTALALELSQGSLSVAIVGEIDASSWKIQSDQSAA